MRTTAFLGVIVLAVAACGTNSTTETTETTDPDEFVAGTLAENLLADWFTPETGLALRFPVDWLPDEEPSIGFVGFTAPPITGDTFLENFNVVVRDLPEGLSLGQYVELDGAALANANQAFTVTGGYTDTMAGAEATAVAFETEVEGVEVSVLRILAIVEGKGVEFTFLASRHEFDNFGPVVQQLIDSITISP